MDTESVSLLGCNILFVGILCEFQLRLRPRKPVPKWSAPSGDHFSVMNIYSRKQKQPISDRATTGYGVTDFTEDPASEAISHHSRSARSRSPAAISAADDYK